MEGGWKKGRERKRKNEYESAKDGGPSQRERMRGMCVRGRQTSREGHRGTEITVREWGGEGSESQRWSNERGECWGMDDRSSEIREDESRMVVRPLGVRGNMLNMCVLFLSVSGLQAVRAISFNCSSLCG